MINRKIEYFITLAECLSFSKTATHHNVSQTAISQYIAGLEHKLGVRLFSRNQRSVSLTDAGQSYYRYVSDALKRDAEELARLHTLDQGYQGSLRVGIGMYEYCSTEQFFAAFLKTHPEIKVEILQYPYSLLTEKLRSGELDIIVSDALCENSFAKKELRSRTLFSSPNELVASEEVALKYDFPNEMLQNECLITNCESDGPSSIQMLKNLLMDQYGFVPDDIAQTNSINAQLMMVHAGHGIAIVPGFIVDAQGSGLKRFRLPVQEEVHYNLMCLSGSENPATELLFRFSM